MGRGKVVILKIKNKNFVNVMNHLTIYFYSGEILASFFHSSLGDFLENQFS